MDIDNSDRQHPVDATRRRLLKASAAAPLFASLAPSAAMAMSSATQCAGGDFRNRRLNEGRDTAVRRLVPYYRRKEGVTGRPANLYEIDTKFFRPNGNEYVTSDLDFLNDYDRTDAWVLELFDVSEEPALTAGTWPQTQVHSQTATPLSGSCWTSLGLGSEGLV